MNQLLQQTSYTIPKYLREENAGLEKYIDIHSTDPTDLKILDLLSQSKTPKFKPVNMCRNILQKHLAENKYSSSKTAKNLTRIEDRIEICIKRRMAKYGLTREQVIKNTLCLHFNIKKRC